MDTNVLKLIKESGSTGPKYDSLVRIFKLYEQLQYATNIKHIAQDIYYWLNREYKVDNIIFTLFTQLSHIKNHQFLMYKRFYKAHK